MIRGTFGERGRSEGFTLVELMIVVSVSSMVFLVAAYLLGDTMRMMSAVDTQIGMAQEGRQIREMILRGIDAPQGLRSARALNFKVLQTQGNDEGRKVEFDIEDGTKNGKRAWVQISKDGKVRIKGQTPRDIGGRYRLTEGSAPFDVQDGVVIADFVLKARIQGREVEQVHPLRTVLLNRE